MAAVEPAIHGAVHLRRRFQASREDVFAAWTDPERLGQWLGPPYGTTGKVVMEARVGGDFSIEMKPTLSPTAYVRGTYLEVEPPERLVFTWSWSRPVPAAVFGFGESRVTVELHDVSGHTELRLTHERLTKRRHRSLHRWGWTASFNRLGGLVGSGPGGPARAAPTGAAGR